MLRIGSEPQFTFADETPPVVASWHGDAGKLSADVPLPSRLPWHKLEAAPTVDRNELARRTQQFSIRVVAPTSPAASQ